MPVGRNVSRWEERFPVGRNVSRWGRPFLLWHGSAAMVSGRGSLRMRPPALPRPSPLAPAPSSSLFKTDHSVCSEPALLRNRPFRTPPAVGSTGWMDGWMDVSTAASRDGMVAGWLSGCCPAGCMDGCMAGSYGFLDGCLDGWQDRWLDRWMAGFPGWLVGWLAPWNPHP